MKYRVEVATDSTFSPSSCHRQRRGRPDDVHQPPARSTPTGSTGGASRQSTPTATGLTWSTPGGDLHPHHAADHPGGAGEQRHCRGHDRVPLAGPGLRQGLQRRGLQERRLHLLRRPTASPSPTTCSRRRTPGTSRSPPSASAYRWRVQRIDSSGGLGDWSTGPVLRQRRDTQHRLPGRAGSIQPPDGPVLEWEPLAAWPGYTVTVTPVGRGLCGHREHRVDGLGRDEQAHQRWVQLDGGPPRTRAPTRSDSQGRRSPWAASLEADQRPVILLTRTAPAWARPCRSRLRRGWAGTPTCR